MSDGGTAGAKNWTGLEALEKDDLVRAVLTTGASAETIRRDPSPFLRRLASILGRARDLDSREENLLFSGLCVDLPLESIVDALEMEPARRRWKRRYRITAAGIAAVYCTTSDLLEEPGKRRTRRDLEAWLNSRPDVICAGDRGPGDLFTNYPRLCIHPDMEPFERSEGFTFLDLAECIATHFERTHVPDDPNSSLELAVEGFVIASEDPEPGILEIELLTVL